MPIQKLSTKDFDIKASKCIDYRTELSKIINKRLSWIKLYKDDKELVDDDILDLKNIYEIIVKPKYTLEWVDESKFNLKEDTFNVSEAIEFIKQVVEEEPDKINWNLLCLNKNPEAIKIIEDYIEKDGEKIDKYCWRNLSGNPSAICILEKNLDKVDWPYLSRNKNAIHLLEKNPDKIDWSTLSRNSNAIHLLEKNPEKIDWLYLSQNKNAIHMLEKNLDKVNWTTLSGNPNAIHLLENNTDKIDWIELARNTNPKAMNIINKNLKKLNESTFYSSKCDYLEYLFDNPNAIHIIEKNLDKCPMLYLTVNPNALHILQKNLNIISDSFLGANPAIYLDKNGDQIYKSNIDELKNLDEAISIAEAEAENKDDNSNGCKRCEKSKQHYKCWSCTKYGCDTCIDIICSDCSVRMCSECEDDDDIQCGCYGSCTSCDRDVDRCTDNWPCDDCGDWLCNTCKSKKDCDYGCSKCRDTDSEEENEEDEEDEEENDTKTN